MAEKIVSPGVFTNEKDLTFLPSGVAQIGAAIVGPTPKGPAFVPTVIRNYEEFKAIYGDTDGTYYVPYAVRSYLKSASVVTVVRIVGEGGYNITTAGKLGSYGILLPTRKAGGSTSFAVTTNATQVDVTSTQDVPGGDTYTISWDTGSSDYITKVIGTSADGAKLAYAYIWFKDEHSGAGSAALTAAATTLDFTGDAGKPQPGATPWITSQGTGERLFRVLSLGDGDVNNRAYKISIINNTLAGNLPGTEYGSFTMLVRQYGDSDQNPQVLETYSNLTLDPDSPNFIARRIGDTGYTVTAAGEVLTAGDYKNVSKHIRVEVVDAVKTKAADPGLNPYGHEAYKDPAAFALPAVPTITSNPTINNTYSPRAYYGMDFTTYDHWNFLRPIPANTVGNNTAGAFNLDNCEISFDYGTPGPGTVFDPLYNPATSTPGTIGESILKGADVQNLAKFTVAMQGGFDGMDPAAPLRVGAYISASNTLGLDCSGPSASGSLGYRKALNVLSNAETYDINMLAMPGVNIEQHPYVIERAITMASDRGDTFVVLDPVCQGKTVAETVGAVANSGIDSNYAAVYWPWVKVMDMNRLRPVWVPPSAVLPRIIAQSDTAAFEWFAPAGLNRGGIQDAVDIEAKLSFSQRDTLYEARINPLATFPAQGVCVWGQKTLQTAASALDRVNVRRLLITLKKYIASSTRYLVFENNTNETRNRFINIVTPYLENVKARQGLYAFRVVMDETNNTPDVIDRNELYGQIFLQPAKTAEFIILDFNILPTGATFDNA